LGHGRAAARPRLKARRSCRDSRFNSIDYLVLVLGAASIGVISVALNGWWVADELEYALRDSGARMLIVDERLFARVRDLIGKVETLEKVFCVARKEQPQHTTPISALLARATMSRTIRSRRTTLS